MLPTKAKNVCLMQKAKNVCFICKCMGTIHESAGVIVIMQSKRNSGRVNCNSWRDVNNHVTCDFYYTIYLYLKFKIYTEYCYYFFFSWRDTTPSYLQEKLHTLQQTCNHLCQIPNLHRNSTKIDCVLMVECKHHDLLIPLGSKQHFYTLPNECLSVFA